MLANVYSSREIIMISHIQDEEGRLKVKKLIVENVSTSAPEDKVLAFAETIKSLLNRKVDTIRISESHEYVETKR